ncbi:hypothetical protein [Kibdelosporangium philippinense]
MATRSSTSLSCSIEIDLKTTRTVYPCALVTCLMTLVMRVLDIL